MSSRSKRSQSSKHSPDSGKQRVAKRSFGPADRASVQDYLDRFATAMTSGDTKAVASLWGVPAFVIGKNEARVVESEAEVEQFFAGAKDMYNQRGIMDTQAEIQELDWIDEDLVIVTVRWPYLDQNEKEIGQEASSYTLLRGEDGQFKLRVATMRGET
jgi:ketosteroid isomerase-like protein